MSDNLSTIRQAAATKAKLPAVDAMPSTAGVTQPEAASQANGETPKALENGDADTAKVPAVSERPRLCHHKTLTALVTSFHIHNFRVTSGAATLSAMLKP